MKKRVLSLFLAVAILLSGCQAQIDGVLDFVEDVLHKVGISAPWADPAPSVGTLPQPTTGNEPSGTVTPTEPVEPTEPAGSVPTPSQPSVTVPTTPPTTAPTEPITPPTEPTVPPTEPTVPPTEPTVPPTEPTVPPTEPTVPPTEPTVPPTEPTEPPTEPTEPPTEPTEPPTEPTEPVDPPVYPENVRYSITVWVSNSIVELTKQQIEEFNNTNPYGIYFDAKVIASSEGNAANDYMNDPTSVGDLFTFVQDQTARLVIMGGLSALYYDAVDRMSAQNDPSSVLGTMVGDQFYGYPMTADNGYFMYYDKSVISESDIDSLEALIAACEKHNRSFSFELENSWYVPSFFFATGCVSEWYMDEDRNFIGYYDTFNSPEGLIAARGMKKLLVSDAYRNSSMCNDFNMGSAVVISGTWDYYTALNALGDNLGVADLPSFTVDGKSYHLSSFAGSKLMGVKPQADPEKEIALHLLAEFLTDYDRQMQRFQEVQWGPSNIYAQKSDEVCAAPHLQALFQQNRYAVTQGQIHGSWWDIARMIAPNIQYGVDLQRVLDLYEQQLADCIIDPNEQYAWSVIGSIGYTNWDYDFEMVDSGNGIWITKEAVYMEAGSEFKVRQGRRWNVNYGAGGVMGGDNFVVETTGTYYVIFDSNTGLISLATV